MDEITTTQIIIFAAVCVITPVVFMFLSRWKKRQMRALGEFIARKEAELDDQLNNRPFRIVKTALGKYRIQQFVAMGIHVSYEWMSYDWRFVSAPEMPEEGYSQLQKAEQVMRYFIQEFLDARKKRDDMAKQARADAERMRKNTDIEQVICNPRVSTKEE